MQLHYYTPETEIYPMPHSRSELRPPKLGYAFIQGIFLIGSMELVPPNREQILLVNWLCPTVAQ